MINSQSGVKAKQKNGPDDIISIKELDEKNMKMIRMFISLNQIVSSVNKRMMISTRLLKIQM